MEGAERPPVNMGSRVDEESSTGSSSPNQFSGFNADNRSVMSEKRMSSGASSATAGDRAVSTTPAESDMVIIKATRNNDLNVFCCGSRDSAS